jgi:CheY-like chemotaxis protein
MEAGSAMKLLVGDDDPLAAQVIQLIARKSGIAVEWVANGLEAADRVAALPAGHFDAVLLDMRMPILDGREAAKRIRDLPYARGTLPIYAMSSNETELLRHPWATWLFDGHLTKPLNERDLMTVVKAHGPTSGRTAWPQHDGQRNAILARMDKGIQEILMAVAGGDCEEAGDAAKRMRLGLLGLVSEDLIRALHIFQLSQAHKRGEDAPLTELRQSVAAARTLLRAA